MSILLEALRKSEKKQRSREVPTIHSEFPSSQPSGSSGLAVMVPLLVVTLAVSAWFVWQQYRAPEDQGPMSGDGSPGISAQVDDGGNRNTAVAADPVQPASGSAGDKDAADVVPLIGDAGTAFPQTPNVNESSQGPRSRTPMEGYQPPVSETTSAANEDPAVQDPSGEDMAAEDTGNRRPGSPGARQAGRIPDFKATRGVSSEAGPGTGESVDTGSDEQVDRSREPAPITYWELPDAIRADVPEIKYTVLVYDKNPAARFVLINGERLAEGDSPQPGLVVKEIRRDGVIFSYRLYQFLVER